MIRCDAEVLSWGKVEMLKAGCILRLVLVKLRVNMLKGRLISAVTRKRVGLLLHSLHLHVLYQRILHPVKVLDNSSSAQWHRPAEIALEINKLDQVADR